VFHPLRASPPATPPVPVLADHERHGSHAYGNLSGRAPRPARVFRLCSNNNAKASFDLLTSLRAEIFLAYRTTHRSAAADVTGQSPSLFRPLLDRCKPLWFYLAWRGGRTAPTLKPLRRTRPRGVKTYPHSTCVKRRGTRRAGLDGAVERAAVLAAWPRPRRPSSRRW